MKLEVIEVGVWIDNLRSLLRYKEVLILHGNVRDTGYILDGKRVRGFGDLIRRIARDMNFEEVITWGVIYDDKGKLGGPLWSTERIENLKTGESSSRVTSARDREVVILTKWLENEIRDYSKRRLFIINYLDKLTPYSSRGIYPKDIATLITLIQKIIDNIAPTNRLIMVALRDTMIPVEYYTNSPRVAVMEIPKPDKDERLTFFSSKLSGKLKPDELEMLSNITDGLYMRDLDNILRDVLEELKNGSITRYTLRKIVNRYRLGTEDDPWSKLPLVGPPKGLIDSAEPWFRSRVIGQDEAVTEVVKALKKARAGVVGLASGQESKPKAVFFFAGPTGVGKTFLAKKLAEYLFDTEEAFIRFDMSEFKEEHTISKLIGSPPGYVGYEEGGKLTNAIREKPFSVVLFDEIEKAHPRIMDIFLQILDDGRLTDSRGQTVYFTESVIIFTSNIGTRATDSFGKPIDERDKLRALEMIEDPQDRKRRIREHFIESVRNFFIYEISRPELLNRIGSHIVVFNYLDTYEVQRKLIEVKLKDIANNFREKFSHVGYRLRFSERVPDYFLEKHKASIARFGGRGLVNAIDDEVGHLLAQQMLLAEQMAKRDVLFYIDLTEKGKLICRIVKT